MTPLLLPWNQPFPPIQTSVRVNRRLALQQVGTERVYHRDAHFISLGLMWGWSLSVLLCLPSPVLS